MKPLSSAGRKQLIALPSPVLFIIPFWIFWDLHKPLGDNVRPKWGSKSRVSFMFLADVWEGGGGDKNCTTWYLARANPHPAPMWTEHQRPTHQHVRPIYNPAHGAPWNSPERELGNTLTRMILSSDNSWRSLRKTPPQMAPKRSNKVQSGSFVLTQPINKWKRLEHQLSYSTNTHLSVCLTTFTSPSELISTLKSLMHYSFRPILLMRSFLLAARLHS